MDPQIARAAVDALAHHLCIIDAEGRILGVNHAWLAFAEANLGDPAATCEGANYLAVCDRASGPDAELAHTFAAGLREVLKGVRTDYALDYTCHAPDEQRWFRATLTRLPGSDPVRLVVLHENITQHVRREATSRWLAGRWLKLQEDERRQIARELHDSTAQKLAAIIIGLGVLGDELTSIAEPKTRALLADCLTSAEACAQDIRKLSQMLHPPLLDELGLETALEAHIDGLTQRSGLRVTLDIAPEVRALPQDLALALFRVTQESLANVARHSGSLTAAVQMRRIGGTLLLEIRDQGRGIPEPTLAGLQESRPDRGLGLFGIRERVDQFNGVLEIDASPLGTTVRVLVPQPGNPHEDHSHPAGG